MIYDRGKNRHHDDDFLPRRSRERRLRRILPTKKDCERISRSAKHRGTRAEKGGIRAKAAWDSWCATTLSAARRADQAQTPAIAPSTPPRLCCHRLALASAPDCMMLCRRSLEAKTSSSRLASMHSADSALDWFAKIRGAWPASRRLLRATSAL